MNARSLDASWRAWLPGARVVFTVGGTRGAKGAVAATFTEGIVVYWDDGLVAFCPARAVPTEMKLHPW